MGMRPALALTLYNSEVQNTPVIHSATLHCNFFSALRGWKRDALL